MKPDAISLVVAYANGRVIGKDGGIPWHLSDDLRRLRRLTLGHTVVMGRRTYESIGHPLDQRLNVVLTRDTRFHPDGVRVLHDPLAVLNLPGKVFILGGWALYEWFLPRANRLYITRVHADFAGDTFFPDWDAAEFRLVFEEPGRVNESNPYPHTFLVYERIKPEGE
ncbi:dihydrofolate reductase [Alicyclobacillus shizuokensis]|uniref:dihydrofolate reductase n=1 Tax=Alicyclobacillus shizuokensis TaxID=392014 RepID=UPI000836860D|nr:dihydrofolate reductase [Alicyclobacillus shizuokensis]MCL6626416.1 dihydrofolate reductase [Alicyclobacillus shizuokensis]